MASLEVPRFALEIKPDRSRVVLVVRGELDIATIADVQAALDELRVAGWSDIVLDLRDVSFVDSRGLALLVAADDRARRESWELSLMDGTPALDRILQVTGLSSHFKRA